MRLLASFCIFGVLLVPVAPATAERGFGGPSPGRPPAGAHRGEGRGYSLDAAAARARRQAGGRVLSAETVPNNGGSVHQIKVLTDSGRVRRYRVDPATGNFLPR